MHPIFLNQLLNSNVPYRFIGIQFFILSSWYSTSCCHRYGSPIYTLRIFPTNFLQQWYIYFQIGSYFHLVIPSLFFLSSCIQQNSLLRQVFKPFFSLLCVGFYLILLSLSLTFQKHLFSSLLKLLTCRHLLHFLLSLHFLLFNLFVLFLIFYFVVLLYHDDVKRLIGR